MNFNPDIILASRAIARLAIDGHVQYALWEKGRLHLYDGSPFSGGKPSKKATKVKNARLLAPCRPSKIVAVGLNYKAHAAEMKRPLPSEPMLFMKPSTTVIGPGEPILRPLHMTSRVDYEAELGVVIGQRCSMLTPEQVRDHVLGFTCLNDVTARDLQAPDIQYTRAKGFDTFCPIGPVIALDLDPSGLHVRSRLDGQLKQNGHTSDMIFSVCQLVAFISRVMTLHPGDVIATGTPSGIGPMTDGQTISIEIESIGVLSNPVTSRG